MDVAEIGMIICYVDGRNATPSMPTTRVDELLRAIATYWPIDASKFSIGVYERGKMDRMWLRLPDGNSIKALLETQLTFIEKQALYSDRHSCVRNRFDNGIGYYVNQGHRPGVPLLHVGVSVFRTGQAFGSPQKQWRIQVFDLELVEYTKRLGDTTKRTVDVYVVIEPNAYGLGRCRRTAPRWRAPYNQSYFYNR